LIVRHYLYSRSNNEHNISWAWISLPCHFSSISYFEGLQTFTLPLSWALYFLS
jgi:hypothetical protein